MGDQEKMLLRVVEPIAQQLSAILAELKRQPPKQKNGPPRMVTRRKIKP